MNDNGAWKPVDGVRTGAKSWGDWSAQAKLGSDTPPWAAGKAVHVWFPAGAGTLAIGARSKDVRIDKVVLTLEGRNPAPSGMGPPETLFGKPPPTGG